MFNFIILPVLIEEEDDFFILLFVIIYMILTLIKEILYCNNLLECIITIQTGFSRIKLYIKSDQLL